MTLSTRQYYQVAEHWFAVETSNPSLLSLMSNYEPFHTDHLAEDSLPAIIFTMQIGQQGLLHDTDKQIYTHIFTDSSEEDMPRIEVYRGNESTKRAGGWLLRVSMVAKSPICCEIECNADFTEGVLHIASDCPDVRFCIDNALMLIFAFRTAPLMTLEMHAAVVVKEELGYLFLGHSGTGKSTHARQWLQAFPDAWLLNDDNPILRVMADGEVRVYGSPWSGKTPCYKSAHAHVGGIVKLSQAPENIIRPITLPEAYAYMLSSASGMKIDSQMADYIYNSIKHIITHVQCHHLRCLPNTEAAEVCLKGITLKLK